MQPNSPEKMLRNIDKNQVQAHFLDVSEIWRRFTTKALT